MKIILLAACGISPQIITETLYALWQKNKFPDTIRILTTRQGRELCITKLLDEQHGAYHAFCKEYSIDTREIDFSYHSLLSAWNNKEIEDISTESDNAAYLRLCMEETFEYTKDESNVVYFSIAGGRKTMGASLALAAQCYARSNDRMYHILVSPEFESNPNFYYPPKNPQVILLRNIQGEEYYKSTHYAKLNLINMPFASIRERICPEMLQKPEAPDVLLSSLSIEPVNKLIINLQDKKISFAGKELNMPAAWLSIYSFFALEKKNSNCNKNNCKNCVDCFLDTRQILDKTHKIANIYYANSYLSERKISSTGITQLNLENFNSYKTKINNQIKLHFNSFFFKQIGINSIGKKPDSKYGIFLDKDKIILMN